MTLKDTSDIINSIPRPPSKIDLTSISRSRAHTSSKVRQERNTLSICSPPPPRALECLLQQDQSASMNNPDESIFGYYNLLPESPNDQPTSIDTGCKEWIPAGLKDKTFIPPMRPSGANRPTCLWIGVPIIPPAESLRIPKRRQYIPKPHLARSLPYFDTENYLLRLPHQPPSRFYKSDLVDTKLADPSDYITWVSEMKIKLMQSKTWRILEDDLEPVPRTSGLHPRWEQVNHQVWFMILANVSREIRREICEAYAWDVLGSWCYLVRFGRGSMESFAD